MKNKLSLYIICIILALSISRLGWYFYISEENDSNVHGVYGKPSTLIEKYPLAITTIDQIAELNDTLYLLDEHRGCLIVYDTTGNYKYTIRFLSHLSGVFSIAVSGEYLYVRDKHWNIYLFQNDTYQEFIKKVDASHILNEIDFEKSSNNYKVHLNGSVWKESAEENVCVIPNHYVSDNMVWGAFVVIVFVFSMRLLVKYREGTVNAKKTE